MRFATSPRLLHIGREEREAKLKEFIAADLVHRKTSQAHTYLLLARAPDSPVARAIASLAKELSDADVCVRALVLDLEPFTDEPGRPSLTDIAHAEIRLLTDPRFMAAHEQLVLSPTTLWLGDCMRRDPAKRDAFEIFHDADPTASSHAMTSFGRLWASGKTIGCVRPLAPQVLAPATAGNGHAR